MTIRRSMTAYGRSFYSSKLGYWTLEIHSVNRKGLDLQISLPSSLLFLDPFIRKSIAKECERGHIFVKVHFETADLEESISCLKELKQKWEAVATALQLKPDTIDLKFLLEQKSSQKNFDEETIRSDFFHVWQKASQQWLAMKSQEGSLLRDDIEKRLAHNLEKLSRIEHLQKMTYPDLRKKIERKIQELQMQVTEEKLIQEAINLAEKADCTEELIRLQSHFLQFKNYLSSTQTSVGRTLEFLCQEIHREMNTLMAKASDLQLIKDSLEIKSELEKIREQVQNLE